MATFGVVGSEHYQRIATVKPTLGECFYLPSCNLPIASEQDHVARRDS